MKVCGIVVEYNPFHKGHIYHLQKAKQITNCDLLIAVTSGNFVQRGLPAIIDKQQRAIAAINNGVDLVIELPIIYSLQQASVFADNAIKQLSLCKVNDIVFGSESNDISLLKQVADLPINVNNLKEVLASGASYASSLSYQSSRFASNDILAISYLKALHNYPDIQPHTILRTNNYLNDHLEDISSATAIRNAYINGIDISGQTPLAFLIKQFKPNTMEDYFPILKVLLNTIPLNELENIFLVNEGIHIHLKKQINLSNSYEQFLNKATTRRYTSSRINRTCLMILNHITKQEVANLSEFNYIRPLAFNQKGKQYLSQLKDNVTIVNRLKDLPENDRNLMLKTDTLYYLNHDVNIASKEGYIYYKKD